MVRMIRDIEIHEDGREEGREEGVLSTLQDLVRDKILSVTDAARRAGIPEEDFLQIMKKKESEADGSGI